MDTNASRLLPIPALAFVAPRRLTQGPLALHPRAAFDMRDPDQLAKCWALSNLQPLWAAENSAKGTADKTLAV